MYKVIIVEDEPMVRRGIVLTLDWAAMNCVVAGEASNGEEGIRMVERIHPDIIVTDVKMPRMDGVEMTEKLRKSGCKSKVIILTAHSDFKFAQSAVRLGVSDYLLKPLKDGDLEITIKNIVAELDEVQNIKKEHNEAVPVLTFDLDKKTKSKYVEEAIHWIRNHYQEDLTISIVAENLEISEGYLSRVFKKEMDYTFTNYLTYYRIRIAMKLLKDVRKKVYEVAYEVGYSDTAYFSNQFKKIVGISPSEYQNRS